MVRSDRCPRRATLLLLLVAATALVAGCQQGGGKTVAQRRAARRQALIAQGNAEALRNAATGTSKRAEVKYEKAGGWIVKGSDFLTFWPCGSSGYYYMRATPPVVSRVSQQYKFAAPRPYTPMYAELQLHYVSDSIRVGNRSFDRFAEVIGYTAKAREDAICPAPKRTTLSDEMERLDRFKVEVLSR
ncbi:MAG: hypothetical protein ACLGIK_12475 [Gemmatimonadota bacterium]